MKPVPVPTPEPPAPEPSAPQTFDDLVALLPAPGQPPIQLHLDGTLALIVAPDGSTAYVNGPVILRYLQRVAPILSAAEDAAAAMNGDSPRAD